MPELAEVEFFRRRWAGGLAGQAVQAVAVHAGARIFRGTDVAALARGLTGARFRSSATSGKQMVFQFSGGQWLGVHLGMSGDLTVGPADHPAGRHDHLVLRTRRHSLVLTDPRMFGRVQYWQGRAAPGWWSRLAPPVLSGEFSRAAVGEFLRRRGRAPIKAVLLMQEMFPGIGNWMADEILWRARIHPRQKAGALSAGQVRALWTETRRVARLALRTIAGTGGELPGELNADIPLSWLFRHRWKGDGIDPQTGTPLAYATIGGRTTCWSPARQQLP